MQFLAVNTLEIKRISILHFIGFLKTAKQTKDGLMGVKEPINLQLTTHVFVQNTSRTPKLQKRIYMEILRKMFPCGERLYGINVKECSNETNGRIFQICHPNRERISNLSRYRHKQKRQSILNTININQIQYA